ncbi:MAG TPA: NUDIX hydrolase [Candidatus Paceibacterota bacterium]
MISKTPFEDFQPKFEVASCFLEVGNKFLLLHRQDFKLEGNKWGVPAGKVEPGESVEQALLREIQEEIGLELSRERVTYFDTVNVRYPEYDFVYHMFRAPFDREPEIALNLGEHKDFRWTSAPEALAMNLVQDEDACIKLLYGEGL